MTEFGVCDVIRSSLRHGFSWHTRTNFKLLHSAPNYNATVTKHKAVSTIQCACFCLNYPACKSPLCAPRLSHHLWVCGLSFSSAIFAVPSQTACLSLGGGAMKYGFQSSLQRVPETLLSSSEFFYKLPH